MRRWLALRSSLALAAALGLGCPGAGPGAQPPAVAVSGERLDVPGAPIALYAYPEVIASYPADDRGAYVVRLAAGPAGARARAALEAAHGDDVVGDDGHVARLTAAERDLLAARPEVLAVSPLAPGDRRARVASAATPSSAARTEVRIDLFADASADEAAAVAAWIAWKGGVVHWQGPTALTAELPADAIVAASRLSPVRWVE